MRNDKTSARTLLLILLLAAGCANDNKIKAELTAGFGALENQQFDEALARADAVLKAKPTGPGTAEALYLRGRALEQKPVTTPAESKANLQAARNAYMEALSRSPAKTLEAYIHSSLANVAYFQDDYATAVKEWTLANEKLDKNQAEVKMWVVYRIGLCRQRLGQFREADQIFAMVEKDYPNTVPAQRAHDHQGIKGFSVQFATFAAAPAADAAITTLRREGVMAGKHTDAQGRSVVLAGPVPSYQQAQALKARYATVYPDALILP